MPDSPHDPPFDPSALRQRALESLQGRHGRVAEMAEPDIAKLVHELEVYQVELELQNEDLRQTQLKLAAVLERYRDLYDHAPVGYLTLCAEYRIIQANRAAAQLCGRNSGELESLRLEEVVHVDERDRLYLLLRGVASTGLPQAAEFRIALLGEGRRTRRVRADAALLDRAQGRPAATVSPSSISPPAQRRSKRCRKARNGCGPSANGCPSAAWSSTSRGVSGK